MNFDSINQAIPLTFTSAAKKIALGSVAGVAVFALAKICLWGGKKVIDLANQHPENSCKKIALKITACALYAIGIIAGLSATLAIAVSTAAFLGGSIGIAGGMAGGPIGAAIGASSGIFFGAAAAAGCGAILLDELFPTPDYMKKYEEI